MFQFHWRYFTTAVILFCVEAGIALFVHDAVIRPFIGDFLVVIMIYCFMKSFLKAGIWKMAISVLIFSYCVEMLQYFRLIEIMGLEHSKAARTIIGTSFSWLDMLAYTAGITSVLLIEKMRTKKR